MARPAVFLDRDGVIVENRSDHVKSWDDVRFYPFAFDALCRLAKTPYAIVMVTNQSAVGRGLISLDDALQINRRVATEVEARGGRFDATVLCPHHPIDGCTCRKPAPGMLERAARELRLDLAHSYGVGDAATDIAAIRAVGARAILVLTGRGSQEWPLLADQSPGCRCVADLSAAVDYILAQPEDRS